jgi:hypothetical protein
MPRRGHHKDNSHYNNRGRRGSGEQNNRQNNQPNYQNNQPSPPNDQAYEERQRSRLNNPVGLAKYMPETDDQFPDFAGEAGVEPAAPEQTTDQLPPVKVFAYGANQGRLRQAAKTLQVPLVLVESVDDAEVVVTLKSHYRKHPQPVSVAEQNNTPLYVLRSNSVTQMESVLVDIFSLSPKETDPFSIAMRETQEAIRKVLQGAKAVALSPQQSAIRRKQHEMARQSNLISHSYGRDPNRRVKIYRQ